MPSRVLLWQGQLFDIQAGRAAGCSRVAQPLMGVKQQICAWLT